MARVERISMRELKIATRGSPLAVWQAEHVASRLRALDSALVVRLVRMRTQGDKLLDAPLAKVGGKGLFVKELELAILDGGADLAVHSMKDVPVDLPAGLHLPVILERADPRDAFVSPEHLTLAALPTGARIGTSSLRRRCQLRALRPDCPVVNLRGNVQTRLGKLADGSVDATVLALSGLQRLGMAHVASELLTPEQMLPAIGQGALGIECRANDSELTELIGRLADTRSACAVLAERKVNEIIGGGCQAPIAAFAEYDATQGRLQLRAMVSNLDASTVLRTTVSGSAERAVALGQEAATELLDAGAKSLLEEVYAMLEKEDDSVA